MSAAHRYSFNHKKQAGRARWRRPAAHRSFDDVTIVLSQHDGKNGLTAHEVHDRRIELRAWALDRPGLLNSTNTAIGQPQTTSDLECGTEILPVDIIGAGDSRAVLGGPIRLFDCHDGRYRLSEQFREEVASSGLAERFGATEPMNYIDAPPGYLAEDVPLAHGIWPIAIGDELFYMDLALLVLFQNAGKYHEVNAVLEGQRQFLDRAEVDTRFFPQDHAVMSRALEIAARAVAGVQIHQVDAGTYMLDRLNFAHGHTGLVILQMHEWLWDLAAKDS